MGKYLDTRDLAERQAELQAIKDAHDEWLLEVREARDDAEQEELEDNEPEDLDEDDAAELAELDALENEVSEWSNGNTLIPEEDFTDYVRELAEDIGAVGQGADWIVIDWEATADGVKMDYNEVTYQGSTYLVRA